MTESPDPTEPTDPADPSEPLPETLGPGRALAPMFTPGGRPGPGRPKGSVNKATQAMREAVEAVFKDLQEEETEGKGRYPHLFVWARAHPTEFYRIMARLMPVHVDSAGRGVGIVVFRGFDD
jgi:hypothetical protein